MKSNNDKLIQEIIDELFTVNVGSPYQKTGTHLAIMLGKWPEEKHLGGHNRNSIEALLRRHLNKEGGSANGLSEPDGA